MIGKLEGLLVSVTIAILLCVMVVLYHKKKKDLFYLFALVHGGALSLFFLYESRWLKAAGYDFLLLMLTNIVAFWIGYKLFVGLRKYKSTHFNYDGRCVSLVKPLYRLNVVGFFIFLGAYIYELREAAFVFPILAENKLAAYIDFPQPFVHYLVVCVIPISTVFAYIGFVHKYKRFWCQLFIVTSSVLVFAILARAVFVVVVFAALYFYFKGSRARINTKKWFFLALLVLIVVTISGTMRTGDTARVLLEIGGLDHWPTVLLPIAWPYLYFSTSIENFRAIFYSGDVDLRYGALSFLKPFMTLLQSKDAAILETDIGDPSAGGFNTFGYFLDAYTDFGVFFPFYTLLLGALSAFMYSARSLVVRLFLPYWIYSLFTSPVNNYFNAFFSYVYLFYFVLIVVFAYWLARVKLPLDVSRGKK